MSASSRIAWLLASSLLSAFALTTAAPPKPYEQLRSEAEAAFARGAFADARDLYLAVDLQALPEAEARWVRFRREDSTWRAAASSQNPDTSEIDQAIERLTAQESEAKRPEDRDLTHAEIAQSIGDFYWNGQQYGNWSAAAPHYAAALDVWAGSTDLEAARQRYLDLVWRMAEPRWANEWFEYGYYSGNWIDVAILENALRIATDPTQRAHAQFLLGQTLAAQGQPARRSRAIEQYEAALAAGKGSGWYDDALYRLACLICDFGLAELDAQGRWTTRFDYPRALELFRRFTREFRAGESRWFDDAQNRIRSITAPALSVATHSQFAPGSKLAYDLTWRNVGHIELALYPTDLTRDVQVAEATSTSAFVESIDVTKLEPALRWTHDTNDDGTHVPGAVALYVERSLAPGAYVLEATASGERARDLLLITDAALTTHSLGERVLGWFCDSSNGTPIEGATVVLWQRWWKDSTWRVARFDGKTVADGTAAFTLDARRDYGEFVMFASAGGRQSFAMSNVSWPASRTSEQRIYATTDRPAYRPGSAVQWKFTVRAYDGATFANPGRIAVRYRIRDPLGNEVKTDSVTLNDFGSAFATLETTPTMTLGEYSVLFERDDRGSIGSAQLFRLEEYKLPEFEVAVKPATRDDGKPVLFRIGDVVTAEVVATAYFGGPVGGADVEIVVKQRPYYRIFARERAYGWLYASDDRGGWWRHGGEPIVQQTTTRTDAEGKARVSFETPAGDAAEYEYVIEARVTDSSRREVVGTGTVRVTQRAYAVDVRVPHRVTKPGDTIDVEFEALDANDTPVQARGAITITRRTYREIWTRADGETASSRLDASYVLTGGTYDDEPIRTVDASTAANGKGSIRFVAPREGYYRIEWSSRDDRGLQVLGETSAFVADVNSRDLGYFGQDLELIVDSDTFKSGASAPFLITSRQSGRHVLFLAVADRILEHRVIRIDGRAKLETLNVGAQHIPNAFLTVVGWSNGQLQQSQVEIVVPPEQQFLDVAVTADATDVEPGTSTSLHVTVKDANGEPVRTELSLAVTDASVTAIQSDYAGDPRQFFYGDKRWLQLAVGASSWWRSFARLRDGKNGVYDELQAATASARDDDRLQVAAEGSAYPPASDSAMSPAPGDKARGRGGQKLGFLGGNARAAFGKESKELFDQSEADAEPAVKVRSDFRETALWLPTLVTDAQGRADAKVAWPDSLTRWNVRAIGFDATSRCGQGTSSVRTRKPLMVRLQAPRFFVVGDEITLSAVLNNDTDAPLAATPTLILEGLELLGRWRDGAYLLDGFDAISIPAHGEARADWRVRATTPGTARFSVTAKADRYADAMERTYPVFAHGVDVFAATSGKMRGDAVTAVLDLPALRQDGTTRFAVQVAPSLAVATLDALPYLVDFPYGCTEQTMSRFLPAVITAKTLRDQGLAAEDIASRVFGGVERATADKTHSKSAGLARLDEVTKDALARLADLQHADGGFGWWKIGESDRFMTAYVVQGLTLAHEAGIAVDLDRLANAAAFLDRNLVEEERRPDMQAWMLYALATYADRVDGARAAEFAATAFDNLWAQHRELNAYTRSLFALAAQALGRRDEARVLVDNLKNGVIRDEAPESSLVQRGTERTNAATMPTAHWGEDGIRWRWSEGGVEATAWAIRALLAVDPKHELVEPAVNWLLRNRRGNQWSNTRDTALCVLAMNDYLRVSGELGRSVGYRVRVNGSVVAERTVAPAEILAAPSVFPVDPAVLVAGENTIEVQRTSGDGPLYFAAQASFFSTEARVQPRGNEIFVRRTYWKLVPRPTLLKGIVYDRVPMKDGDPILSGERVEVVLTIEAKNHYEYLVFEDLKPAGLEAVGVRSGEPLYAHELKRSETEHRFGDDGEAHESTTGVRDPTALGDYGTTGRTAWIHTELRDRKVALFLGELPQGVWEVRYDLRAEVPGSFAALPVVGHAMYVPEIRCNGEEIGMRVEERR
jgi:uncharacterized protein YfaS (alpha-2-macroglobulin family)